MAKKGEVQVQKSPAEFFAENQAIAGFDNLGKSLYTSLRELVENSLDACEAIEVLPEISVTVEEYTQAEFNALDVMSSGSPSKARKDTELFAIKNTAANSKKKKKTGEAPDGTKKRKQAPQEAYFRLTVRDNGCGMSHSAIPNLLGRVLSGSKYGVRQTRGKFGLGAKMALIWAKKSTGQPIRIKTCHRPHGGHATDQVSTCVLDIDIFTNSPRILEHKKNKNTEEWLGTEMSVLIAGNWTTYRSRIVQYLQQLAVITPYAELSLDYKSHADPKRALNIHYDRRSEQMPPPAATIKHHPSAVNNLIIQHLIKHTKTKTLESFLTKELSSVNTAIARRLLAELRFDKNDENMHPEELNDKQITRMVQMLKQVQLFKAPDCACLSPLGEYNLNLGVSKVLEPDLVATARSKAGSYEGHPFVIEAAVSLGGNKIKEGISVVRFANRIPLLFEGGADVSTRVANTKINWSSYKIDHKRDKIGVFVSIVSTKIPFKGTSKEYIGDDATEIQTAVKKTLQQCCVQLKGYLAKRHALKDAHTRKARLVKYVPDVGRALFGMLDSMRKRKADLAKGNPTDVSPTKRMRLDVSEAKSMISRLDRGEVTEKAISKCLMESIDAQMNLPDDDDGNKASGGIQAEAHPVYIVPLYNLDDPVNDIDTPLFTFRPIAPLPKVTPTKAGTVVE